MGELPEVNGCKFLYRFMVCVLFIVKVLGLTGFDYWWPKGR